MGDQIYIHRISEFAYQRSENIEEFVIPDNVLSVGRCAFHDAKFSNIVLGKNIQEISDFAFTNTNIKDIKLPKSLKIIGAYAFNGVKGIKKLIIPEGVTSIGDAAFANISTLEEVYLPNSLNKLNPQMFLNCKNLKVIHLPENIDYLPDEFFRNCKKLNIKLNSKIKSLGNGVFNGCKSLKEFPKDVYEFGDYCFKNCYSLESASINSKCNILPNHLFDSCIRLSEVNINGEVDINDYTFRNCIALKDIPKNIKLYGKYSFDGCTCFTKVTLNSKTITEGLFRGCTNLSEITDFDNIKQIEMYGLSNTGFINLDLTNIASISNNILSHSKRLENVNLGNHTHIGNYAFYDCPNLEIKLPVTLEYIGRFAFAKNKKTKKLVIPKSKNLKSFGVGAFSYNNFEKIVSKSKQFDVYEDVLLIDYQLGSSNACVYACGNKNTDLNLKNYSDDGIVINPLDILSDYLFSGAKYLKTLTLTSTVSNIGLFAFYDSDMESLTVETIPLYAGVMMAFYYNNQIYTQAVDPEFHFTINSISRREKYNYAHAKDFVPFKKIKFIGHNVQINSTAFNMFKNLETIEFDPDTHIFIFNNAFNGTNVKEVDIPDNVRDIGNISFPKDCTLKFRNNKKYKNILRVSYDESLDREYRVIETKIDKYIIESDRGDIKLSEDNYQDFIEASGFIKRKPTKFLDYFYSLIDHDLQDNNILRNGILADTNNKVRNYLLDNYTDDKYLKKFLKKNLKIKVYKSFDSDILDSIDRVNIMFRYIDILRKLEIKDDILYNDILINSIDKNYLDTIEYLYTYYKDLIIQVLMTSGIQKDASNKKIFTNGNFFKFIGLLIKYNIKDKFLFKPEFMSLVNEPLFEKFLSKYSANFKRLLSTSMILDNDSVENKATNLLDLFTLMEITGAFYDDERISQRATTFIIEKITMDKDENTQNTRKINGDNFHRLFNFKDSLREQFDEEFAQFFIENFNDIYDKELLKAGFIQRAYVAFREISRTSTSDKGIQRHKKVTFEKVDNYLRLNKFVGVPKNLVELAKFIGDWYDQQIVWDKAKELHEIASKSPRNIFTKTTIDLEGNPVYDLDPSHDLIEKHNGTYTYEWLNKHADENLILGKYCSCCAHLNGAGFGIMKASIILDNVQNLVIRNSNGEIVAKSTLYVNKEKGYGVFNNVEAALKLTPDDMKLIYDAFMRGANAFIEEYNKNNTVPITMLTIGMGRNRLKDEINNHKHKDITPLESINYGTHGEAGHHYNGDSSISQSIVLKLEGGIQ